MTDFKAFRKAVAAKRTKPTTSAGKGKFCNKIKEILDRQEIVVQRLTSDVQGKAQKYLRMGPQEFVSYDYEEVSIENIKKACFKFFRIANCDVLVGERGPRAKTLDHLTSLNIIFVRFMENRPIDKLSDSISPSNSILPSNSKRHLSSENSNNNRKKVLISENNDNNPPSVSVPKSLSLTKMLRLGKVVWKESTLIKIQKFNIDAMSWSPNMKTVEFDIENKSFGKGSFREVFKAVCLDNQLENKEWVVKKFLKGTENNRGFSADQEVRRTIQAHLLAKNFAHQLGNELNKSGNDKYYGEIFRYHDAYLGILNDEFVAVEVLIPGHFVKYVNNDGTESILQDDTMLKKAGSLMHFTYEKSERMLLLTDIQGVGYNLVDPEIASKQFAVGNLSMFAINSFVERHTCSRFCVDLQLSPFTESDREDIKKHVPALDYV